MLAVADRTLKANTQYNLKGLNKLVGWKTHSHDAVDKTYSVHCKNTGKLQKQRGELIFALLLTHSLTTYTSDSLWKIWLVESIQSIHISLQTWHDKCNICCRYCLYHIKFNVYPVTKPLGVFSETKWLNASLFSEDELCDIIKQLLNSVFAWYHELSKPCVCVICLSLRPWQITQTPVLIIHDIMLNLIQ